MTHVATMGTSSCATIAIAGFGQPEVIRNKKYMDDPTKADITSGQTVEEFYDKILYPTSQPLGKTADYPFDLLMEEIDKSRMNDKFTILTLNRSQKEGNDGYWVERLKDWGFFLIDETYNNIGEMCYIYTRNRARPKKDK